MNIVDVDFRYAMRFEQVPHYPAGVGTMKPVLQWRKLIKPSDGSFCIALHSDGSTTDLSCNWTDWQDVRTETEE